MANRERPLSPHMQVYRWRVQMVTSLLHRATGIILVVGSLIVAWGLLALAGDPEAWNGFTSFTRSTFGFLILFGWSWALAYHLINGIRHLVQDAGYAYRIESFVRNSWISIFGSLALTVLIWVVAMMKRGGS